MTKAIMLLFDSLNRHMLPPYGCDWIQAPNFARLAERTVTFENAWVGSMPCMPARRDLHTGRLNFLHRSWGPLEPFDDSMPGLLTKHGIHTHLVSDHYHYWEAGGATYHTQYTTWEMVRGQEGDPWKGELKNPEIPEYVGTFPPYRQKLFRQDWINRNHMKEEFQHPQARTFEKGLEFIRSNHDMDGWFLQLETFDPHEPFFSPEKYKKLYPHEYSGKHFDWPNYQKVTETPEEVEHCRREYAALVSMCDEYLGKVLDAMDQYGLWDDTMLIVTTDHGFLLGEHDWWAKNSMPFYNEVASIPMFYWDPQSRQQGERYSGLAQLADLAPTLLDHFGIEVPNRMTGSSLRGAVAPGQSVHEAVLFGLHGAHVNVTDGRYVYMRAPVRPDNAPLYNYTLMPCHMASMFDTAELQDMELSEPFSFTQGVRTLKIPSRSYVEAHSFGTLLYDVKTDPGQERPITDPVIEERMKQHMISLMKQLDSPNEQYERLGLEVISNDLGSKD
jgi:arylsulfatase A-like enzyme